MKMNAVVLAPVDKDEPCLPIAVSPCAEANDSANTRDATIVHRADQEAFKVLFLRYKDKIFSYQFGMVGDIEDAHDLTQKTLIRAWEKLPTLRDETRFLSWLYTIARNVTYDYWRSKKKILLYSWENLMEQQSVMSIQGPEEVVEMAELIRIALLALTPKYRACLLLHTVYGCSTQEIAKLVGISKKSVATYLCSARSQFRQAYLRLRRE